MIMQIFSVYDNAVGAYLPPQLMQSSGAAIRSCTDALQEPNHQFARHAGDYALFHLGEWDDGDAKYTLFDTPRRIIGLHELLAENIKSE